MLINLSPRLAAFILASATSAVFAAPADVKNFQFVGTVKAGSPMSPANQQITGSFSYDTSDLPSFSFGDVTGPGYSFASYEVSRPLQATVNGHTIECSRFNVTIHNNLGGNREDILELGCQPMVLDGTNLPNGVFNITLLTNYGKTNAITSLALPPVLDVKSFDYAGGVVLMDSASDVGTYFFVNEINTIQEGTSLKTNARIAQPGRYVR